MAMMNEINENTDDTMANPKLAVSKLTLGLSTCTSSSAAFWQVLYAASSGSSLTDQHFNGNGHRMCKLTLRDLQYDTYDTRASCRRR
jgi:hypothetical protein